MTTKIEVDDAPQPAGPYSQGLKAGPFVFVSGQGPKEPETGETPEGAEAQTHQVLKNVRAILAGGGVTMRDVVKVTVHLSDLGNFDAFNAVYRQYFQDPLPTRTTVQSVLRGIEVEIDVIAYRAEAN